MNEKAPTRGQRLNLILGGTDNSTSPRKLKGNNSLKTLEQIARKWAARGYYPTPSAAMRVLLEGVNHG